MLLRLLIYVIPLIAGVAMGAQAPVNVTLARYVGPLRATLVSVTVSLLTLAVLVGLDRQGGSLPAVGAAPRWALSGGLLGVMVLVGTVLSVPRLGTATTITLIVTGQLATAAVVDHFGLLGVAQRPLDATRVLGLAFLLVGGALVVRR
jgi:transporter family-2 protein